MSCTEGSVHIGGASDQGVDVRTNQERDLELHAHRHELRLETRLFEDAARAIRRTLERSAADNESIRTCLSNVHWVTENCVNSDALTALVSIAQCEVFEENQQVFKSGGDADKAYIILQGDVKLIVEGQPVSSWLGLGGICGERALSDDSATAAHGHVLQKRTRTITVETVSACVMAVIDRAQFLAIPNRMAVNEPDLHPSAARRYVTFSLQVHDFVMNQQFRRLIWACIVVAAVVAGVEATAGLTEPGTGRIATDNDNGDDGRFDFWQVMNTILLLIFTVEVVLKWIALCNPWQQWVWFNDYMGMFDAVVVVFSCIPSWGGKNLIMARILRLLRIMREFKSFPQLQMILNGLSNAMVGMFFIFELFLMMMYFYAILGTHLFRANDPRHFASFHVVFVTLAKVATEGDWPQVMYTNMYGCWE